jgi:hypothetical protein
MQATREMAMDLYQRYSGEDGITSAQLVELAGQISKAEIVKTKKTIDSDTALICECYNIPPFLYLKCLAASSKREGWQEASLKF